MENSEKNSKPQIPELKKPARIWDMLDPNIEKVSTEIQAGRMDICKECPFFMKITKQCRKCGCHMPWKTQLPHSSCPIGKWESVE